jgi:hypothetical protein
MGEIWATDLFQDQTLVVTDQREDIVEADLVVGDKIYKCTRVRTYRVLKVLKFG